MSTLMKIQKSAMEMQLKVPLLILPGKDMDAFIV